MMEKLKIALTQIPMIRQLHVRYDQLSSRDQNMLFVLTGFLVAVVFYMVLWSPLSQWSKGQMNDYRQQVETQAWLHKHIGKAKELEKRKKSGASQRELPSVVSHIAKEAGITISRIQPDKNGLAVWLDDAAYQKVLAWLVTLESNYYIAVQQIKIEQLKENGRIKGFIHLGVNF